MQQAPTLIERVENAIAAVRRGEFVVVADDTSRENEGDLIARADTITTEAMAFLVRHTSGLVCVAMTGERLDELGLPLMVRENTESQSTAFTISADYKHGTQTGISASDRARTLRALADPTTSAEDFARPGHIFPLRAKPGGVLARRGHTEAAVDLATMAGAAPAGVLCEIVNSDGSMARGTQLQEFAASHGLVFITVDDLATYRRRKENLVEKLASARIPTRHGTFEALVYRSQGDGLEHVALVRGQVRGAANVLVRVHSECFTGDVLGSRRCDCGEQLDAALERIATAGCGVVVYLRGHEGRGVGLSRKLHAYQLQDRGRDTVDANVELGLPVDARSYDVGAQILTDIGITTLRLMSNNPAKFTELDGYPLKVVEAVPLLTTPNPENLSYLRTKELRLGHQLGLIHNDRPTAAAEATVQHPLRPQVHA
jgi:3,4-dihydroxy 2-butanone 4-phosphate synthase / GTP cyclohydrolase II